MSDLDALLCEVDGCERELEIEECYKCGGEGYGEDLHEYDPLYYEPGTFERCDECQGVGTHSRCEVHGYIDDERDRGKTGVRR